MAAAPARDWRTFLTIEDRQGVRDRIGKAYQSLCPSYEELLAAVVAIDEELLHLAAPSRLDYFKSGLDFPKRVRMKQRQLKGLPAPAEPVPGTPAAGDGDTAGEGAESGPGDAKKRKV